MNNKVLNDLYDYDLKIYQYSDGFKFSIDSILLAEYVKITNRTKKILDLCTGNAVVPLILSTKTKVPITGFEIQDDIYNLAKESINYNNKDKQIKVFNADIKNIANYTFNEKYDIITCNPPYFKVENLNYINEKEYLAISRHEIKITLEDIFFIASSNLNNKGEFYLVHRINRLDEIIIYANKYNLNVKNICLIQTKENLSPYICLIRCIKCANLGVKISKIYNIEGRRTYQDMFKEEL